MTLLGYIILAVFCVWCLVWGLMGIAGILKEGWKKFTSRIQKIRRGIGDRQQKILNIAEFGTQLPPEQQAAAGAMLLNDIQTRS